MASTCCCYDAGAVAAGGGAAAVGADCWASMWPSEPRRRPPSSNPSGAGWRGDDDGGDPLFSYIRYVTCKLFSLSLLFFETCKFFRKVSNTCVRRARPALFSLAGLGLRGFPVFLWRAVHT